MRPEYETDEDLRKQRAVADMLEVAWGCRMIKTPRFYDFDFTIFKSGKVKGYVEVKCRDQWYPEMILSLHKWQAGLAAQRDTDLPFFVVYEVDGDVRWMQAGGVLEVSIGGRTDRGDDQDMEPVVNIPMSMLKKLYGRKAA